MAKKINKPFIISWISGLILVSLGCGQLQVGVVTPMPKEETAAISQAPNTELEQAVSTEQVSPPGEETAAEEEVLETASAVAVTAWLGHIASLPEGSQYDDMLVLSPNGSGEFGLTGASPEIEAEIRSLRDAEGPHEFIHFWGSLQCNVPDYNNCQLTVEKMQYGANYSEEEIVDWMGTIQGSTFNSGNSFVFELSGDFPMWYSIYASQDPEMQAQIESLRDTGTVVKVGGKLLVGIPDVNGTRIEVSKMDVVEIGSQEQPQMEISLDPTANWPVLVNDRYAYQIKYPPQATISFIGPLSFSSDELPEGMAADEYLDSLFKEYTDRLCIQIEYSLGWIYIAAPPNRDTFYTPCGPTGLGAGEVIYKNENLMLGDQLYQASGMEFKLQLTDSAGNLITGESLDLHGEMFLIDLEDGTRIRFGSTPRTDATYADYLMKTKEMLLQTIATYEKLP